jgi:hypothetical protein
MKLIFILSLLLVASVSAAQAFATLPSVDVSYANLFDEACAQQTKYQINPSWVSEINTRLPEFKAAWAKDGPVLLKTSEHIVGKNFREKQFLVSLSICSLPSMGDPLLVNMRYSLKSFSSTPLSMDVTVGVIFHELLHRYLAGKIPANSKLLLKYKSEDETVTSHLHLLALQKAVYLKLGRADTLKRVVEKDQALPNKSYTRAWEIIDHRESYKSFVEELRQ